MFGQPPMRDIKALRRTPSAALTFESLRSSARTGFMTPAARGRLVASDFRGFDIRGQIGVTQNPFRSRW